MEQIIVKHARPNAVEYSEMTSVKKLLTDNVIRLYHGNKNENMIPSFGAGSSGNDYGKGFYTTPDKELAKEWAWGTYTTGNKAYVHTYELEIRKINILNFTEVDSIHWITELVYNRRINLDKKEVVQDNLRELIKRYKLNTDNYDVIIGYRADDSYFAYAESFVSGAIYKDTLERALRAGELGLQVFIKSEKAFRILTRMNVEEVPRTYRSRFVSRDKRARDVYHTLRLNQGSRIGRQTIYDFI